MASLLPGFEYDIFISYRQKDNKYDGWVTEFVDNLKKELEATFKEEITVYFDINPRDGLLETHDVDASLKDKLKCLIFIPVISRTYCDPKSFAWEHEFKAFVELASKDIFGLKVKLPGGNVAGRVLPVRIHDLDAGDVKLCESVLGGVMRGVEFIYKEPGVNRSLTAKDNEEKNLNKTNYRNQINKVALAIREILLGLQNGPVLPWKEGYSQRISSDEVFKGKKQADRVKPAGSSRLKLLSGVAVLSILIVVAIVVCPKIFKKDKSGLGSSSDGRISIAVMPFQNMTNDTIWNVWQDGIQGELINYLTNYKELKVRQVRSITGILESQGLKNYASLTPSLAGDISKKLDAGIFIYGSIKKAGDVLRVNAQLIDTKTEEIFKSFNIEGPAREEMIFQITDSLSALVKNFIIIFKLGKELNPTTGILNPFTSSPEAYRYYIYSQKAFSKSDYNTEIKWLTQAIAIDSNFTEAASGLSWAYRNLGMTEQAKKWCLWLERKKETMPVYWKIYQSWTYSTFFETPYESLKYLLQLQELDDQLNIHSLIGIAYLGLDQSDKAVAEFEKSLEIVKIWKDVIALDYTFLGKAYHQSGQYRKEKKLYMEAEKLFPDDQGLISNQIGLALTLGDTISAYRYVEKYVSISKEKSEPEVDIISALGWIYYGAGSLGKAEKYFREALSIKPDNPERMNDLAWFLIETGRNVNEGMELNKKAMELNPGDYRFLGCNGWGLYKQGKLKESLETLEKAWELRTEYDGNLYHCIQEVKKAIAGQR